MDPARGTAEPRRRGSIRPHYGGFQVRVTAGVDPTTGERIILHETVATRREAERALTRLLAEADAWKSARTKASFGALLDRWLAGHEVAITTRVTYESLIRNHIRPALGTVPLTKLHRGAAEILESFYGDLRRCSRRRLPSGYRRGLQGPRYFAPAASCRPRRPGTSGSPVPQTETLLIPDETKLPV
jgi:hypothetical protein